tara:strand:+ start:1742 stop:2611 length:870 start_codon:yes stop_codon:yes gene_type:complete
MTSSFHIPRVKVEVATQLKDFKTPLEKIDYLEILAYEIRDKLDWMKRHEASVEPGNKIELLSRKDSLSAEREITKQLRDLKSEYKKDLERRQKLAWPEHKRLPFPIVWDQVTYLEWEAPIEGKGRKHDWCLWLRQGLIKNEGDDWRFKDNILRHARLDAIDKGETDDEILWCCLSIGEEFVHFLDIQMVNPSTQLPTGRGKRATPELHKVIWRAYRYASTSIEIPSAQEVWDALQSDPIMFDPERILMEDSFYTDKFFYLTPNSSEPKSYKRVSLDARLNILKKHPPKV